jgi:predicted metal-dependent hydrolase
LNINLKIIFKQIKNANLRVKQDLEVILSVPLNTNQAIIDDILIKRQDWIYKQLDYFKQRHILPKSSKLANVFQFLGESYPLKIIYTKQTGIIIRNGYLELSIPEDMATTDKINNLINAWYKQQAINYLLPVLEKYSQIVNKTVNKVVIRQMKTRWGSCNPKKAYINLNVELMKKLPIAIEYVILHELAHLTHYKHDYDFYNYISLYMPDWRQRQKLLES